MKHVEIERTNRCCSETESVTVQICSGRNWTEPHTQIRTSRRGPLTPQTAAAVGAASRFKVAHYRCEHAEPRRVRRRTADIRHARSSLLSSVLLPSSPHPTSLVFVNEPALRQLIPAFVTSCLDYCNMLFVDCSDAVHQQLQHIHNSAMHVIHSQLEIERTDCCCSETESVTAQFCSGWTVN